MNGLEGFPGDFLVTPSSFRFWRKEHCCLTVDARNGFVARCAFVARVQPAENSRFSYVVGRADGAPRQEHISELYEKVELRLASRISKRA